MRRESRRGKYICYTFISSSIVKKARRSMSKGGEKKMLALIPVFGPILAAILTPILIALPPVNPVLSALTLALAF